MIKHHLVPKAVLLAAAVSLAASLLQAAESQNPFVGRWALTIPGGGAGWLGVTEANGELRGEILWGGGSVVPVASTRVEDGKLVVTRIHETRQKDPSGKTI